MSLPRTMDWRRRDDGGIVVRYEGGDDCVGVGSPPSGYERTFDVAAPIDLVWQAFTVPEDLRAWHGHAVVFEAVAGGRILFSDEGHADVEGDVVDAVPQQRLRWRIRDHLSVVTETFEEIDTGTRVTVSHISEGPVWSPEEVQATRRGWDESIADLVLLLDHGIREPRHMTFRSRIGATVRDTIAGAEVVAVERGTFADEVGMTAGDLILRLGDAPIFGRSDVSLIMRANHPGTSMAITYVRDGRVLHGQGRLSPRV